MIHSLLDRLPPYREPSEVPFANGLYFFYERGEASPHAPSGRITRIGNHPKAQGRLVERLGDHYSNGRNAKGFSVFRRYLGGALMRRESPNGPCLSPAPGRGHWEHGDGKACDACRSTEDRVSAHLQEHFLFRCVRIDDQAERNRFEDLLIASVAQCDVCQPSERWLGRSAYREEVRATGLWNAKSVYGSTASDDDLARLRDLVSTSGATEVNRPPALERTLLVIPCSGGKGGAPVELPGPQCVADYLGPEARELLAIGRRAAFARPKTWLDDLSEVRPAIGYYTGHPYATTGVRQQLVDAIGRGLHCLIVSGGYGVLRAEEDIHDYGAHLGTQTAAVWRQRLPVILKDYVGRVGIQHSVVILSKQYAACVPKLTESEVRIVPEFRRGIDEGSPIRVVPRQIGAHLSTTLGKWLQ